MGICMSWVAIRDKDPQAVLDAIGWRRTGAREEGPESPTTCAALGSGWFLIAMMNRADAYDGTLALDQLSQGADLVAGFVEEHVMFSGAVLWRDGAKIWSVEHDAQRATRDLVVAGQPPAELSVLIEEARSSQDAEDQGDAECDFFFDVPVGIAERITGFRHDRSDADGVDLTFDVLTNVSGPRRAGWLRSLFGRG
jgi:hypothetical protein